ncbi:MAG: hypothetical protein VYD20_05725 [Candidatus Neomarinimicrobiota bacterium]|nr:hypothetical protein [Candidatus Neomarinimicrobiota bacterium]|tara:strand:+ start:84 stop:587 length:504 start_codon:yes stop_codon:yes gene_type:complete
MDGLAYWLFIAALYFLSSLMKRRQQKFARNKLEREDIDADDSDFIENKTSPAPESMDDFFDQLRNYGKEFLDFEEEDDDQYLSEDEEQIEQEVIIEEPSEDKSRAVFEDLSEEKLEPIHEEYRITKKQNQNMSLLVNSILSDNNKVKKAIILKEIFDKPRALRRSMR